MPETNQQITRTALTCQQNVRLFTCSDAGEELHSAADWKLLKKGRQYDLQTASETGYLSDASRHSISGFCQTQDPVSGYLECFIQQPELLLLLLFNWLQFGDPRVDKEDVQLSECLSDFVGNFACSAASPALDSMTIASPISLRAVSKAVLLRPVTATRAARDKG